MVKRHNRTISILLSILLVVSMCCLPLTVTAATVTEEEVSASAETRGYYATNPDQKVGKRATITIDGAYSDWSQDMLIAQGAAWDLCNAWKGAHENGLMDLYSFYGAYDDENLYFAWQLVNTTDTWQNAGDASLMDGGKPVNVPFALALSVDPVNGIHMNNRVPTGPIWGLEGLTFDTHVDHLLYMSAKVGEGTPSLFKAKTADGTSVYDEAPYNQSFTSAGISYKRSDGFLGSSLMGLDGSTSPSDPYDLSANWVDFMTFTGSKGKHDTKYDTFYEIKIPLSVLGINSSYVEQNGVGAMIVATSNVSGLDCLPHDTSMLDNVMDDYSKDPSTSHEKEDLDNITVPFARLGGSGDTPIITTKPITTTPITTIAPVTTTKPVDSDNVTAKATVTAKAGDTVEFKVKYKDNTSLMGYNLRVLYDNTALALDNTFATQGYSSSQFNNVVVNGTDLASQGRLAAVASTQQANAVSYSVEGDLATVRFTALKDITTDISVIIKEARGIDEVNLFNSSTYQPLSSATTVRCEAAVTTIPATTTTTEPPILDGVTGQTSISVKAGETVEYVISLKNANAISAFSLRAMYDNEALALDGTYGIADILGSGKTGVTVPNFTGSLTVNGPALADQGRVTVVGSASEYEWADFSTEKDLAVIRFTALKDTTTTLSYLIKDLREGESENLFGADGKPLNSAVVTNNAATILGSTNTTAPTSVVSPNGKPMTGYKTIDVKEGDVVRYEISLKTPQDIAGWSIWAAYDEEMFTVDSTFGKDGIATNQGIPFALGQDTTFNQAIDNETSYSFYVDNTVSAQCADYTNYSGYTDGQRAFVIQFVAQKTGTTTLAYWVREVTAIVNMANREFIDYADPDGSGEMINGASSSDEVIFVSSEITTTPITTVPAPTTTTPVPTTVPAPTTTTPVPTTVPVPTTTPADAPTIPSTGPDGDVINGGTVVKVHAGDTVTFDVSLKSDLGLMGIVLLSYFDSDMLEPDTTYGTGGCKSEVSFERTYITSPEDGRFSMVLTNSTPYNAFKNGETLVQTLKFTAKEDGYARIYFTAAEITGGATYNLQDAVRYYYNGNEINTGCTISCDDEVICPHSTFLLGDADLNGQVTIYDALLAQKHAARLITLEGDNFKAANVVKDDVVDLMDALRICQYVAYLIDSFE